MTLSHLLKRIVWYGVVCILSLAPCPWPAAPVCAAGLPSLLRGVVVADSPVGVRVVSVEEFSQAYLADLRPEDVIVRIHGQEVHSIDEFAALSSALKGHVVTTSVVVFRNGRPHGILLHLYSYPVLNAWGIEFVPDYRLRFAQPQIGLAYWSRFGRGFEEAHKPVEALDAYLNGLHNVPSDLTVGLRASELFWNVGRTHIERGQLSEGIGALEQAVAMLRRLFEEPLTDEQLLAVKEQLQQTLRALREISPQSDQSPGIRPYVVRGQATPGGRREPYLTTRRLSRI